MIKKEYKSYDEYVSIQKSKIHKDTVLEDLMKVRSKRIGSFLKLFQKSLNPKSVNGKALCVGARLGEEVEALIQFGYDAIGVDLNEYLPLVVSGDFNKQMSFNDKEFSLIFSNSVDHVYDLSSWSKELNRITKEGGQILLMLMLNKMSNYESIQIDDPQEVIQFFPNFSVVKNKSYNWDSYNHMVLLKKN